MQFSEYNTYNASKYFRYDLSEESNRLNCRKVEKSSKRDVSTVETFLRNVFLPEGYPDSVSDDYLSYQIWDTVQAFASSISGSLATQAVLEGVGVGDETATPLAATLTWLMRHGAGMTGQIMFTWFEGSDLDHNCKKWRLFADFLNDSALCLELSGPLWPTWSFQSILCIAGVCRALVGVSGGATRTAITQHQARANNISDVAAKDGSQETLVNLAALFVNLSILPWLSGDVTTTWILFGLLTFLHLFANFRAVKSLHFHTLNKARLLAVLRDYAETKIVSKPEGINESENVILGLGLSEVDVCGAKINLGVSLNSILSGQGDHQKVLNKIQTVSQTDSFAIFEADKGKKFDIVILENCQPKDYLRAYVTAFWMAYQANRHGAGSKIDFTKIKFENFDAELVAAGWRTTHLQVNPIGWVGSFKKSV